MQLAMPSGPHSRLWDYQYRSGPVAGLSFNRTQQGYPKAHWIDAACVGESGNQVKLDLRMQVWQVKATGHGSRQMCRMDRFGFPRTSAKTAREVKGFRTGDMVQSVVPSGKRLALTSARWQYGLGEFLTCRPRSASCRVSVHKHCSVLHRADGYSYLSKTGAPLGLKNRVSAPRKFHEIRRKC